MTAKEQASIVAKSRRLENGKYSGVVVQSVGGRLAIDEFEVHCTYQYETQGEAIIDAERLANKRRTSLFYRAYFPVS
jgi:hypothetical protein